MHRQRLVPVIGAWLGFAIIQCALNAALAHGVDGLGPAVLFSCARALLWGALTPVVWRVMRVLDESRAGVVRTALVHFLCFATIAILDAAWRRALLVLLGERPGVSFGVTLLYYADLSAIGYVAIVVAGQALAAQDALAAQANRAFALRAQLARARLETLEAQVRPHFLFNALGTIAELLHEAPAEAAEMLRHLSALLRFAMMRAGRHVSVREELSALEHYIDIQRARFSDWLEITSHIDPGTLDCAVPRLTMQPLVENAIRHGLAGRTDRGHIAIASRRDGNRLVLTVRDDGIGLTASATRGYGIGLTNVRERLANEYGDDFSLRLSGAAPGTVAEIIIPARPAGDEHIDAVMPAAIRTRRTLIDVLRRHPARAIILAWLLWGVLWFQQSIAFRALRQGFRREMILPMVGDHISVVILWAAMTPLALMAARRWPVTGSRRQRHVGIHVACACLLALAHVMLWHLVSLERAPLLGPDDLLTLCWNVLLYASLVGVAEYVRLSRAGRERQSHALRLEAELAEEQFGSTTAAVMASDTLARLERLIALTRTAPAAAEDEILRLAEDMRRATVGAIDARALVHEAGVA